jgi:hypothetical protein
VFCDKHCLIRADNQSFQFARSLIFARNSYAHCDSYFYEFGLDEKLALSLEILSLLPNVVETIPAPEGSLEGRFATNPISIKLG